jgi:hypothetical protein
MSLLQSVFLDNMEMSTRRRSPTVLPPVKGKVGEPQSRTGDRGCSQVSTSIRSDHSIRSIVTISTELPGCPEDRYSLSAVPTRNSELSHAQRKPPLHLARLTPRLISALCSSVPHTHDVIARNSAYLAVHESWVTIITCFSFSYSSARFVYLLILCVLLL